MKNYKHIFLFSILLVVLLVPTFLFNNNHTHDWGDDFAQYIYQAKEIKSVALQQHKVLNIDAYGSNKRGILFSDILSFVPAGKGIQPYLEIIFTFFLFSSLFVFLFFKKHFPPVLSFLMTLSIYFNYHVIQLKEVVMTEFAFMLLLYFIYWIEAPKKNKPVPYLMGLLFGCLIAFRSVGIVFFISYLLIELLNKEKTLKEKLKDLLKCSGLIVLVLGYCQLLLLPETGYSSLHFYNNLFTNQLTFQSILANLTAYWTHFQLLFEQELPGFINITLFSALLILFIVGLFNELRKKIDFTSVSFLLYIIFLLLYPYNGACIRFLIPVLPLIIFYCVKGLLFLTEKVSALKFKTILLTSTFVLLLLLSNTKTLWLDAQLTKNEYGPYRASIQEDFRKIRESTPSNASIGFSKPFIINLFCRRDAYFYNENNLDAVKSQAEYLLLVNDARLDEVYQPQLNERICGTDTLQLNHFLLIKTK